MKFVDKPHQEEYPEDADSKFGESERYIPLTLDRSNPAVLH